MTNRQTDRLIDGQTDNSAVLVTDCGVLPLLFLFL